MRDLALGLSQQAVEAGGSQPLEAQGTGGSSPNNDEASQDYQMACVRQARQEGATRREPVVEPPLANPPARTWWIGAGQQRTDAALGGGRLPRGIMPANEEAIRKACGVRMARLQGKSWAPTLSNGQQ